MVVVNTVFLCQNRTDRTKYPEGNLCLFCWSYWVISVVCGTLAIYSIYLGSKKGKTPSEYEFGHWSAVASLIVAGVEVFGRSVYGSGKCPAFLAAWYVSPRLYVFVS